MADVNSESSVLKDSPAPVEESCTQPGSAQRSQQQDESPAESKNEGEPCEERSHSDVYRYIREDLFTSEIFKVEIQNLPKYIGFNDLKKFLNKLGLNPHKTKLIGKHNFAFVTFKNQEDRDKAMKLVHGAQWKGKVLSVRLAKPKADPLLRKRRQEEEAAGSRQPASKRPTDGRCSADDEPLSVQIANAVTPLWQVPYEEQLKRKEREVEAVLLALTREMGNSNKALLPWLFVQKEKNKGVCCPCEPIRPSPVQTEYRNKCEFVIGTGADGEDKMVGFRLGKYKGGSCAVVSPSDTIHVPEGVKRVVVAFQNFIRTTPYAVYSPETYEGHWRQLTVRTSRTNQIMVIIFFNPQKVSEDELDSLKASMRGYFRDGAGAESGVTSLHFVRMGQRTSAGTDDLPCELVTGDPWIYEELLGLRFRISPHSFFQTLIKDQEGLSKCWQEYFSILLNRSSSVDAEALNLIPQQSVQDGIAEPLTIDEIKKVIYQTSSDRTSGKDGIPVEIYKAAGPNSLEAFHDVLKSIWDEEKMLDDSRDAWIVSPYKKKGRKADCGNHRDTRFFPLPENIFAQVLLNRLSIVSKQHLPEAQWGFRPQRSTMDMIFTIRQPQEKCIEKNMPLYSIFIDLTTTFDMVNREALWTAL